MQKYLDNTTATENGVIYIKDKWKLADNDEIVYIGEYGLDEIEKRLNDGESLTDAQLVGLGIASTKNSIREEIKMYYPDATDKWIDRHNLIEDIISNCSWECTSTMIDQMDNWDIWEDYGN